jgi:hypothetical protein
METRKIYVGGLPDAVDDERPRETFAAQVLWRTRASYSTAQRSKGFRLRGDEFDRRGAAGDAGSTVLPQCGHMAQKLYGLAR